MDGDSPWQQRGKQEGYPSIDELSVVALRGDLQGGMRFYLAYVQQVPPGIKKVEGHIFSNPANLRSE